MPTLKTDKAKTAGKKKTVPRKNSKQKRGRGRGTIGKEPVIHSTRELLRKVPLSDVSRKSVAEAANVDPALVRYYFNDLQNLLTEVLKILVEDYYARSANLDIDPNDPEDAIEKRIHHIVAFHAREPSFYDLFVEQIVKGKDEWAKETRDAFTDRYFGSLRALIEAGREQGKFRDDFDPRYVYISIIGAVHFFLVTSRPIFERLFGEEQSPEELSEDFARFLTEFMLRGMRK